MKFAATIVQDSRTIRTFNWNTCSSHTQNTAATIPPKSWRLSTSDPFPIWYSTHSPDSKSYATIVGPASAPTFRRSGIQLDTIHRHFADTVPGPILANKFAVVRAAQNLTNLKCFRFERYWSNDWPGVWNDCMRNVNGTKMATQFEIIKTHDKSSIGSSQSPSIPNSLVPNMWLKSIGGPLILFGVLPGWTGVFKPLRFPPLYVDGAFCKHVASPTTKIPFNTASIGPTSMFLWAAASKCRSQLNLILHAGPGVVIGLGEVLTEYRPGWGISIVRKSLEWTTEMQT